MVRTYGKKTTKEVREWQKSQDPSLGGRMKGDEGDQVMGIQKEDSGKNEVTHQNVTGRSG